MYKLSIFRKLIKALQFLLVLILGLFFWGFISSVLDLNPNKTVWIALPLTLILVATLAILQSKRDVTLLKRKLEKEGMDLGFLDKK
jgi:hypothetical protein